MSDRFEIRECEPSDEARAYGVEMYYDVWDNQLDRRVSFGRYRTLLRAEGRLERENAKAATR